MTSLPFSRDVFQHQSGVQLSKDTVNTTVVSSQVVVRQINSGFNPQGGRRGNLPPTRILLIDV